MISDADNILYIWIYLLGATQPVLAGRLALASGIGQFIYSKRYLSHPQAISIDPIGLPLNDKEQFITTLQGYPSAILDAAPDRWGIGVINRIYGELNYPAGYLLLNDPGRSGCLAFSLSDSIAPKELSSRHFTLQQLLTAAETIEKSPTSKVNVELLKALNPGTGGARPKCNIIENNEVWIAKFPGIKDSPLLSIPRLEHASMMLARACGIHTAETKIQTIGDKDICLVKRFDRQPEVNGISRLGYLSARTVFYADNEYQRFKTGSYARLARWLHRFGAKEGDQHELYRRMVFNCAIRNTDDHELNHGLIYNASRGYVLSPAFDLVPQIENHHIAYHALLIGNSAEGTTGNLLSVHEAFGLNKDEATAILTQVSQGVQEHWQDVFYECGFGDEELRRVAHLFRPLPGENRSLHDFPIPTC